VADFEAAADAILRKAPNARASAVADVLVPAGTIPLPRKRASFPNRSLFVLASM